MEISLVSRSKKNLSLLGPAVRLAPMWLLKPEFSISEFARHLVPTVKVLARIDTGFWAGTLFREKIFSILNV